jgi:hypothetical protein
VWDHVDQKNSSEETRDVVVPVHSTLSFFKPRINFISRAP